MVAVVAAGGGAPAASTGCGFELRHRPVPLKADEDGASGLEAR